MNFSKLLHRFVLIIKDPWLSLGLLTGAATFSTYKGNYSDGFKPVLVYFKTELLKGKKMALVVIYVGVLLQVLLAANSFILGTDSYELLQVLIVSNSNTELLNKQIMQNGVKLNP